MKPVRETNTVHLHNNLFLNSAGFTLVELMVVVVIIGVLVTIAVPVYNTVRDNAAEKANEYNKRIITGAVMAYIAEEGVPENGGEPAGGWEEALVDKYLEEWPEPPTGYEGTYKVIETFADYKVVLDE